MAILDFSTMIVNLACTFLLASMSVFGWPIGIVGLIMSAILFCMSGLYADMILQIILLASFSYGWYCWHYVQIDSDRVLKVQFLSLKGWLAVILTIAVLSVAVYYLLILFTNSTTPCLDSITSVSSIVCTFLASKKYIDNWVLWIVIDSVYTFLYAYKNIYFASATTVVYLVVAVYGYKHWKKIYISQKQ